MIKRKDKLWLTIILLGILSLIIENSTVKGFGLSYISHIIDLVISVVFVSDIFIRFIKARGKVFFVRHHLLETVFALAFVGFFTFGKYYHFFVEEFWGHSIPVKVIVAVSVFNIFKAAMRISKMKFFFKNLTTHPAQTIMLSFFLVILIGTILLMTPIATVDLTRIGFINALFTATSATCVTGLIVLDTATRFSAFGKTVIMCLIQVGGLGIMMLGYFTAFLVGMKLTYQDKMTISYMLDEVDTTKFARDLRGIVLLTFLIESAGALMLYPAFLKNQGSFLGGAFYSIFHAVSAFCNAGFALFTDNLASFHSSALVSMVIAILVIAGGISFAVLINSFSFMKSSFERGVLKQSKRIVKMSLNTKVVLSATAILLVAGTLFIYKVEHKPSLLSYDIKTQYLMAFFQSVTLRTAGFNTMDISSLHIATYTLMILFMFIGGASGSCAGGIKVNTVGVIWAYVKSIFNNRDDVVLFRHSVSKDLINQAFMVMFLSLCAVFTGALILSLTENKKFIRIMFEVTSAFGTVGLSTGITQELTGIGKVVITVLMFIGRLGPLTVIAALSRKTGQYPVQYPQGKISIG